MSNGPHRSSTHWGGSQWSTLLWSCCLQAGALAIIIRCSCTLQADPMLMQFDSTPEANWPVCRGGGNLPGGGADVGLHLIGHTYSQGSVAYLLSSRCMDV